MQFRGREMAYKDLGMEKFNRIINMIIELGGILESSPKFMGNRVFAMMCPDKKVVSVKGKHTPDQDQSQHLSEENVVGVEKKQHPEKKNPVKDEDSKATVAGQEVSSSNS